MVLVEAPMHRADGSAVRLADLLSVLPANDLLWSVIEFEGASRQQNRDLRSALSWGQVLHFAGSIESIVTCVIVAFERGGQLDVDQLLEREFAEAEFVLVALDGAFWKIGSWDEALAQKLLSAATG